MALFTLAIECACGRTRRVQVPVGRVVEVVISDSEGDQEEEYERAREAELDNEEGLVEVFQINYDSPTGPSRSTAPATTATDAAASSTAAATTATDAVALRPSRSRSPKRHQ